MSRSVWVYDKNQGKVVEKHLRTDVPEQSGPYFMKSIQEFVEPISGTTISSRRQLSDFERAHGVTQVGNEKMEVRTPEPSGAQIRQDIHQAMVETGYLQK